MSIFYNTTHSIKLVQQFVHQVFPMVDSQLAYWQSFAISRGCPELQAQALASIRDKKFHCQGGSIYGLYNSVNTYELVRLIVALQTISDYLDNLCDRAGITDENAFRQLHLAMTDALDTSAMPKNYYEFYPFKDDGGYLTSLVLTCQEQVSKLPAYNIVKTELLQLASLYSELQTYKHIHPAIRQHKMKSWIAQHINSYPQITEWEFAAATGSTLGIFMLCAAADDEKLSPETAKQISKAYFPWISGFHILLDYFIDGAEDRENGDLNFVSYYQNQAEATERLVYFGEQALLHTQTLPEPLFNLTVVQGLFAMYLSDPKTNSPNEKVIKKALLNSAGLYTKFMYVLCKLLRKKKKL